MGSMNLKQSKSNEWYTWVKDNVNGGVFTCDHDECVGRAPCWNAGNNPITKVIGMGIHKLGKFQTNLVPCVVCGHKGTMHHQGYVWKASYPPVQNHPAMGQPQFQSYYAPVQPGMGYPGMGYPGMGYGQQGYPGMGYGQQSYPGMGHPGMGYGQQLGLPPSSSP